MPNMDNENGNMENTIIELNTTDEETSLLTDTSEALEISDTELKVKTMPKRAERNKKKSFKEKWHDLPKQAKIAIIVIPIVILLIVIGLLLYFFVFKKDEEKKLDPDETIVFEKGNYKYENGFLIFTDDNDEELGKYECKDKDVEKCYLAELSNEDDFDTIQYQNDKGEEITKTSKVILKRYAFVFDDDKITLYDIKEEKTHGDYELIKTGDIDKNYVVVKDQDDKYGILSFEANSYHVLIPSDYDYIGIINNPSVFVAKKDGSSFLIDDTNKTLTANMNGDIKNFNAKYVSLSNGIKYTLYDYKGNAVMEDSDIEYIDFKDNYVFTIKDNRLYAFDDSLSKLTETGIKLKDAEYRTIYVFDDKNNYQETKSAYTITSDTSKIIVETDGKEKEINVYEGAISKTLPFVNYFDGSLFFYADEEKQDLIGSYTCSNKNTVTSSTKSLDNCFIAQAQNIVNDTANVGFIPIINKKYAFIRDTGSNDKDQKIVITDIENAKVLGTYQKVDVLTRTEKVSHIESLDELVYAQNTSGKYGIIAIDSTTASKKLNFDYTNIAIFKNDYILAQDSEYYRLFPIKELSSENEIIRSKYPIYDYSYGNFVVNKDKKYTVYNDSGKIVIVDLDYVKLESDLLIGVKNNKLNLYSYVQDATGILKTAVDLSSIKYTDINVDTTSGYEIIIKTTDNKEITYKYSRQGIKISQNTSDNTTEDKPANGEVEGDNTSEEE